MWRFFLFQFVCLFFLLASPPASALETLSTGQMKAAVGQAGISIGLSNVTIESYDSAFALTNPDDALQYLRFEDGHSTLKLSNSSSDIDGDGLIGCITIDLFSVSDPLSPANGQSFFFLESKDMELEYDLSIDTVNFCGTDIGSVALQNFAMPSYHLLLGAHDSGIDAEFGAQISIDQFSYGTDSTDTLTLSGIHFAQTIAGDPSSPATWTPSGQFTAGNIAEGTPVTMDIAQDTTQFWMMTDSNGEVYTVSNPRANSGYIAINLPLQGSIRIENMTFGTQNLGTFALDNIQAHKLLIEIPGRGLGAP